MARHRKRPVARPEASAPPVVAAGPGPQPLAARPNRWFLAAAVLLEVAWIGFLVVMVLTR